MGPLGAVWRTKGPGLSGLSAEHERPPIRRRLRMQAESAWFGDDSCRSAASAFTLDRLASITVVAAVVAAVVQAAVGLANGLLLDHRYSLDPDAEFTIFAWASSVATFSAALAAFLLAAMGRSGRIQLLVLAALTAFYSVDDMLVVHERLTKKLFVSVVDLPPSIGGRLSAVVYFPLLAGTLILLLLQATRAPRRAARLIVVALGCLAAAVVLELTSGVLDTMGLITFRESADVVIAMAEESLELAGWILIGGALTAILCSRLTEVGFRAGAKVASGRGSDERTSE